MPILSAYGGQWKALCITQCVMMENKEVEGEDHVYPWWIIFALLLHTLAATIDVWSVCLSSWHPTSTPWLGLSSQKLLTSGVDEFLRTAFQSSRGQIILGPSRVAHNWGSWR